MADKTRLLFVCTANQQRSPTAESLFSNSEHYEARSCGIHALSTVPCESDLIKWADVIFCMEDIHRQALLRQLSEAQGKKIVVLNIPDVYVRNDPRLIMELCKRLGEHLDYPP